MPVGGFSGYYYKSTSSLNDFKDARFTYSKMRPVEFEGQYASGEKISFMEPGTLPDDLLKHLADLESVYE